jgi:hypothetical protein
MKTMQHRYIKFDSDRPWKASGLLTASINGCLVNEMEKGC